MLTLASSPLSSAELLALAHLNLAESMREHARWTGAGVIDEREGTLRVVCATRFPAGTFNCALCLGAPPSDPTAWLATQRAFFAAHERGFSVYLRGDRDEAMRDVCAASGLSLGDSPPGMVCEAPLAEAPHGPQIEIQQVQTTRELVALTAVQVRAYASIGLPENVTESVFGEPERLVAPHVLWFLAHHEGAPAAAAMVLLSHGIAGIYWVATTPEQRGRGLAEACVRSATNAAFARGARAVVLQASRMGEPIYRRMGYREVTRYPWYFARRR